MSTEPVTLPDPIGTSTDNPPAASEFAGRNLGPVDEQSHTPGPWWVERRVGDALQVNAEHRGKGSSYCIASVNHWEGPIDHANARLIAAAPDLLAACKRLSGVITNYVTLADVDALNAAIAKAEGRS